MIKINTTNAPEAIGPYSQAIIIKDLLFTSGQIPINPQNGKVVGSNIEEQAEQVMKNIGEILKEAGTKFDNVIKTTCYLSNMGDFKEFNDVYGKYFISKPARSCVEVKKLPRGVLCEVETITKV